MISILLAAYNGEQYLVQQLESLLTQTRNDFTLYIRDDCSTDGTWEIIRRYAAKYPDKIRILRADLNSGVSKYNFMKLMTAIRDDYIFLCDQDDVWLPDKIERSLLKIQELEKVYGKDTPLLLHTDLTVVDSELRVISPSFRKAMTADWERTELRHAVVQNILTGCAAVYNRALAELLTAEPGYCVMHDWWLFLAASAFGKIGRLYESTMLYRQHSDNGIGAKDVRPLGYKLRRMLHGSEVRSAVNETYRQAESFLAMYRGKLSDEQFKLLAAYAKIPKLPKLRRIGAVFALGTFKSGVTRKIGQVLFI